MAARSCGLYAKMGWLSEVLIFRMPPNSILRFIHEDRVIVVHGRQQGQPVHQIVVATAVPQVVELLCSR